tara:strand:- start:11190 stop:11744 length:555 start_codon:yes stop_codon:yes gene_type:complete
VFFDPNEYKTPSRIDVNAPATAIPVRADYKEGINTPSGKVVDGKSISIQWGLVGTNGKGTVIRQDYFIEGTSSDDKAKSVFAGTCKAMGYTAPLASLDTVSEWLASMVQTANPVELILEPEGDDSKYSRVRFVNPLKGDVTGTRVRAEFGDLLAEMTAKANESAARLESASTAGDGDLDDALGI